MQGKIYKGIGGSYLVHVDGKGIILCKAKGIFRKDNILPMIGDNVELETLDDESTGIITDILERKNSLIRPAVANIDQALVIFAAAEPVPNLNLLDRFLIMMEMNSIPSVICFNKRDLISDEREEELRTIYESAGYRIIFTCAKKRTGIEEIRELIDGKITSVAGPSGAGKSSIINLLQTDVVMETGQISKKLKKGKHTTRHVQFIPISVGTWIIDTPGFTSLSLPEMENEELKFYYPEFKKQKDCRFLSCMHLMEPDCQVKEAVQRGEISNIRYENYVSFAEELKQRKKY